MVLDDCPARLGAAQFGDVAGRGDGMRGVWVLGRCLVLDDALPVWAWANHLKLDGGGAGWLIFGFAC